MKIINFFLGKLAENLAKNDKFINIFCKFLFGSDKLENDEEDEDKELVKEIEIKLKDLQTQRENLDSVADSLLD